MRYASREDAGERLARRLEAEDVSAQLVLGLPRGGVIVAARVALKLRLPLDVLIVRKLGHPQFREFAVGALAEPDVAILDDESLRQNPVSRAELDAVIAEETRRLAEYRRKFHLHTIPDLTNLNVLLVDDGLATGATMEAAVRGARTRGAARVAVAVPVASTSAYERLAALADRLIAEWVDAEFTAVGAYYRQFYQTTDEEVIACLQAQRRA